MPGLAWAEGVAEADETGIEARGAGYYITPGMYGILQGGMK
jgi:hypothetical protein